jgi:hypothetical protein
VEDEEGEAGVLQLDEALEDEEEEHCIPVDPPTSWIWNQVLPGQNYTKLPLLEVGEGEEGGEHKIVDSAQPKHLQTIVVVVVGGSCTG